MSQKSAKQNRKAQELEALLKQSEERCAMLESENKALRQKMDRLTEQFLNAQRAQFGQSSEKAEYVMADQMRLFNEAEASEDAKPEAVTVSAHKRTKKPKRTLEEIKKTLPKREVILDIPDEKLVCAKCGGKLKAIGKKFLRTELVLIPARMELVDYYTRTYACEDCEPKTGFASIYSAKPAPALLKHSLASASTVADVMVKKYVDGIPLARQEKIWEREGVELSRATLANWVIQVSQNWLKPVYERLKETLLASHVIHADETVIQVLKEDGKKASSESRMWVYATSERNTRQVRYFEYQPDRKGLRAAQFLDGFHGCLVTDGYAGYDQVPGVIHCGCWAHMRRKWRDAIPKGAATATSKAAVGYDYVNKLFLWERKFAKMRDEDRKNARQAMEAPLLDAYWLWLKALEPTPGSKLAEAVTYAKNQQAALSAFLEHGDVEISNNAAENAIPPFAVGRKNWSFSDTVKGAESSAIVYTLVETAKANGLEPYAYLNQMMRDLPWYGHNPSREDLNDALPWSPRMQQLAEVDDTNDL